MGELTMTEQQQTNMGLVDYFLDCGIEQDLWAESLILVNNIVMWNNADLYMMPCPKKAGIVAFTSSRVVIDIIGVVCLTSGFIMRGANMFGIVLTEQDEIEGLLEKHFLASRNVETTHEYLSQILNSTVQCVECDKYIASYKPPHTAK
jgi:hypothetical protein